MSAPRFFVSSELAEADEIQLDAADSHHAASVLRLKPGDPIVIVDVRQAWDADIVAASKRAVRARVARVARQQGGELPVRITVLQALIKGTKFDSVVEKTVELGASAIVPVLCERSYASVSAQKLERWRRIARSAAAQSQRRIVPLVNDAASWSEAVSRTAQAMPVALAWENAHSGTLHAFRDRNKDATSIAIAVGPEGSFTETELEQARAASCDLVSLGPTVLRTETAAAAMIAALASLSGWW
jgi:16S rRNA (uracil1498-N3)-methyltransferase